MTATAVASEAGRYSAGGMKAPTDGSLGSARQFVIFHLLDEMFAVPLSEVREIIRMPDVVKVPMSPPALEGLSNLRGSVLPVVSLRSTFHYAEAIHDDSTRVVVLDSGRPVGLVVDRMANVVTVEADRIETSETIHGTVDADLLTGMIKSEDGRSMVMILDVDKVIHREFKHIGNEGGRDGQEKTLEATGAEKKTAVVVDEDQLVSFEVAGQEYAFPIDQVQEIVQLPGHVTHVPNAPSHVLGVISLRNRLLPLVSLRQMFGLPSAKLTEANKVVVVSLGEDGGLSAGVVMDSVKEVLRVSRSLVEAMPALLAKDQEFNDVQSICRLQDGKRLVSILSAERMFNVNELRKIIEHHEDKAMAEADNTQASSSTGADDEEQVVVFRLIDEEYGVPIEAVQEIVRVPDELTRVPKTADFIEGVVNLRGVILPVVDQRRRFGLPDLARNDRQRIMVFMIHGARTGFIVDSVSEVMRIPGKFVGPAPDLSDEQAKLIRRVANIEGQKRMIMLLEVSELLHVHEVDALKKAGNA
jgi:purine-binding chemotaxis protein CheW